MMIPIQSKASRTFDSEKEVYRRDLEPTGESLSEGLEEEGEHAVAGEVGEGGKFEGVVAAGEFEGAGVGAVVAEGVEHLAGELREHGGVVLSVDHERVAAGAHAALDVGHRADGRPVFAKLVDGDVVAKAFPDMISGHALADDVGVIGGSVEEAAGADAFVMDESDVSDGGADAGAENPEPGVALLLEPVEAAASVLDGLAVGLKGEADIGAANLVGALVALGHAAVVVGHAHLEDGNAEALDPVAEAILAMPFGVPVGEKKDCGAALFHVRTRSVRPCGKKLGVNRIVFRPGRLDGAGEGEDIFAVQLVIRGGRCGIPFLARLDGPAGVFANEGARIGFVGGTADVFEAPMEWLDAPIVVGGPAAVLVAADFTFEPVHANSTVLCENRKETAQPWMH